MEDKHKAKLVMTLNKLWNDTYPMYRSYTDAGFTEGDVGYQTYLKIGEIILMLRKQIEGLIARYPNYCDCGNVLEIKDYKCVHCGKEIIVMG